MNIVIVLVALVVGAALGAVAVLLFLRRNMISTTTSAHSFEETERRLREQGPATPGWGFPAPELDFVEALAKRGFEAKGIRRAKIFFLCNPKYASTVVGAESRMIGMMPCHWAIYENSDGGVFISRLNIPLMSKMFGGVVGRTMSQVGRDEHSMLPRIAGSGGTSAAGPKA